MSAGFGAGRVQALRRPRQRQVAEAGLVELVGQFRIAPLTLPEVRKAAIRPELSAPCLLETRYGPLRAAFGLPRGRGPIP
jgi:hypothetical protein